MVYNIYKTLQFNKENVDEYPSVSAWSLFMCMLIKKDSLSLENSFKIDLLYMFIIDFNEMDQK